MAIEAVFETAMPRRPEDVFAALVDLRTWSDWLVASGVVGARTTDGTTLGEATEIEIEQRLAGRASMLRGRVVAYEADRRLAVEAMDADGIAIALDARVSPDGALSRLRWSARLALPLKYRFFESMIRPQLQAAAAADMERLRRRLSAVAD